MKAFSFERYLKLTFLILLAMFSWSLWAQGQPVTNAPPPTASEAAASVHAPPKVWLTFGLDRLAPLRYAPFADIPLWQYLSSLIYVFLAFYVSRMLDALIGSRMTGLAVLPLGADVS